MSQFIQFKKFKIHFRWYGSGPETMLAFPGFHRTCDDFEQLSPSLGKKFTIYSFDLFYHGKTEWQSSEKIFTPYDFKEFVEWFLKEKKVSAFSLLGYSLGGKLCLMLLQLFPSSIHQVVLLAPYGIKQNKLLAFLERFEWPEKVFFSLIKNPKPYFIILKIAFRLHFISWRLFDFLLHQMGVQERRQSLFDVWKTYIQMRPDLNIIKQNIENNNIQVFVFSGSDDPIEPPQNVYPLLKNSSKQIQHFVVPLNHNLVCPKMNHYLAEAFQKA